MLTNKSGRFLGGGEGRVNEHLCIGATQTQKKPKSEHLKCLLPKETVSVTVLPLVTNIYFQKRVVVLDY